MAKYLLSPPTRRFMKNLERFLGYGATWAIHHLKVYKDRKYIVGDEEQIGSLNRTLNLHP